MKLGETCYFTGSPSSIYEFFALLRNSSDLHIYKGLYGERNKPEKKRKITKNPLEPKLHQTALNQLKNHTAHKESGAGIQVSGFNCNSTVIFRVFFSGLFLSPYKSLQICKSLESRSNAKVNIELLIYRAWATCAMIYM